MQAVILAGGLGTRLWPLTLAKPKPLLPVMGRPLLAHLLERLPRAVREVFLAVSFEADQVRRWVAESGDASLAGRVVRVVTEDPPLGTGGALANLVETAGLGQGAGPTVVLNGDLVADMDLEGLVEAHTGSGGLATIALVEVEDVTRFGIMDMGKDWRIRRFVEKPSLQDAPSRWANAGAYVLEPGVLGRIPRGRPVSLEREVFPGLTATPQGMRGHPHRGLWVDCGTRESYLEAHRLLAADAEAAGRASGLERSGDVFVDKGVRVGSDVAVQESVLLRDVVVAEGARVVGSIVGEGARIGAGAVLERCIVAPGAVVRAGLHAADARVVDEAGAGAR